MASSMGKSVLGQGSDFVDEDKKQCQPCSFQGKNVAANTFCVDCDSYLCTQCTAYHKALKGTKTHALIKPDDAKKIALKTAQDKCTRKCSVHPAKAVKYFCVAHSHLGCSVCCNIDHKRCDDVEHIQTVAADIKRHAGFNKFDEDLHTLGAEYKSGLDEIQKDFHHLQEDEHHLRKTYAKFRKDVIDGLDQLERDIFKQTKNIKDKETRKLDALSKNLDKSKSTVDGLIQKLDLLLSSGHKCDAYVLAKTDQKEVTSLREELLRAFDGKTYKRYEFKQNLDFTKAGTLGELTTREDTVSSSSAGLPRRVVMDGPAMARLMKEGTRVKRGKDWCHGNWYNFDHPTKRHIEIIDPVRLILDHPSYVLVMDGPAIAKLMKAGVRVRRGKDWHRGFFYREDGGAGRLGTVTGPSGLLLGPGWFNVQWDNGFYESHRMGAGGAFELEIVQ